MRVSRGYLADYPTLSAICFYKFLILSVFLLVIFLAHHSAHTVQLDLPGVIFSRQRVSP